MSSNKSVDMRETISALVDGEASDWELRKTLQQSAEDQSFSDESREDWAAYQAIGAILRKEPVKGSSQSIDISSAVMDALEEETTHSRFGYFGRGLAGSFGQATIAASVAVIALVGIQQYQVAQTELTGTNSIAESSLQTETAPLIQPPAGFEFQPVTRAVSSSFVEPTLRQGSSVQIPVDRDQLQAHLDELVQQHSEHSVSSAQEVIPMIRVPASSEAK